MINGKMANIQIFDQSEMGCILDMVSETLKDRKTNMSKSEKLHEKLRAFYAKIGKNYDTFEQIVEERLEKSWSAGVCYFSVLQKYKSEMLAELGEYLDKLDAVSIKKLSGFLDKRTKEDFLQIDGSENSLADCFNIGDWEDDNDPFREMIAIIERHLLACKYVVLCAEEKDPVLVMKHMVDHGHSSLIGIVAPVFQLISQKCNSDVYETINTVFSIAQDKTEVKTIKRQHLDRSGIERQDPYYFVLLKCPSCAASGSSILRHGDRGCCNSCGKKFDIIRNVDDNQAVKDHLKKADEYVEQKLLEKLQSVEELKSYFATGFGEVEAQMKDLASRISGMAVSSEYKREILQVRSDMQRTDDDVLLDSSDAINKKIDDAVERICGSHAQDIVNLIEEQKSVWDEFQNTQQEIYQATKEGGKENRKNFLVLNDKIDEVYGSILDAWEIISVIEGSVQDLKQSSREIDKKTTEIVLHSREARGMLNNISALVVRLIGQAQKASAENRKDMESFNEFLLNVKNDLKDEMGDREAILGVYFEKILDFMEQIQKMVEDSARPSKCECPWCRKVELMPSMIPNRLRCGNCGQEISEQDLQKGNINIPTLKLSQNNDGDKYYTLSNVSIDNKDNEVVVVNISSKDSGWLQDPRNSDVVVQDRSANFSVAPNTLILVSDGNFLLNDEALRKLCFSLMRSVTKIIVGAEVTPVISKNALNWCYDKTTGNILPKRIARTTKSKAREK